MELHNEQIRDTLILQYIECKIFSREDRRAWQVRVVRLFFLFDFDAAFGDVIFERKKQGLLPIVGQQALFVFALCD